MERTTIKNLQIIMIGMVFLATGCYYDVEEEIYPTTECSTMDMSYQNDILPILSDHCFECHAAALNFGNITLEGHDNLLQYVANGQLLGAIKHDPGYSPMPKTGGMLLQCNIEKIEAWIVDGAPDN